MQLTLNNEEALALVAALDSYLSDLSLEIGSTENYDLRQELKVREVTLNRIREALEPGWSQRTGAPLAIQPPVLPPGGTDERL